MDSCCLLQIMNVLSTDALKFCNKLHWQNETEKEWGEENLRLFSFSQVCFNCMENNQRKKMKTTTKRWSFSGPLQLLVLFIFFPFFIFSLLNVFFFLVFKNLNSCRLLVVSLDAKWSWKPHVLPTPPPVCSALKTYTISHIFHLGISFSQCGNNSNMWMNFFFKLKNEVRH